MLSSSLLQEEGKRWKILGCQTLVAHAMPSVFGHCQSPSVPLLFIPVTGSSFHCVHPVFWCLFLLVLSGQPPEKGLAMVPNWPVPTMVWFLCFSGWMQPSVLCLCKMLLVCHQCWKTWHERSCLTVRTPDSQVRCATLCPTFPCTGSSVSTAVPFLSLGYLTICSSKTICYCELK